MKKLSIFLLALVAGVGTIYASDTQIDGIWYDFDSSSKTATVTYKGSTYYYYSNEYSGEVVIPASVTYNDEEYSVMSIGYAAFRDCTGLASVTIPNSVTNIGYAAFEGCTGLTSVTIPNSVTSIGKEAFEECTGLTSVTIPNSVTSIGDYAFRWCTGLTSFDVAFDNPNYSSIDGVLFKKDKTVILQYPSQKIGTSYNIPNSVTSIGDYAFAYCTGLTSVTIPNSVTSIGVRAFSDCSGLTSVTIPNSVTSIGKEAFAWCTGLTSVTMGNSVTSIEVGAFYGCSSLTSPVYNAHVFAKMPTSYSGAYTIPDGIESIAGYAFWSCDGLTSVTIPNSVTSIGSSAFYRCSGLTSVTIPNSVTSIGDLAFCDCSGLTSITNYSTTPQSINSDVFNNVDKSTCVLNVPKESVSLYQAAEVWKEFTNIVGVDAPQGVEMVLSDKVSSTKLIRNGNVYILTDDKTYTITGQQVK